MAVEQGFEFAPRINPNSSMAMGFVDQQVNASGPPAIVTFTGNTSARLTSAVPGDYFDNGSVAHFSHVIEDLYQLYSLRGQDSRHADGEPFTERCQYMFRSNQLGTTNGIPAAGNTDQFTNGGGPAFVNNLFHGTGAALLAAQDSAGLFTPANQTLSATFTGLPRVGHEEALQQVSPARRHVPPRRPNDGGGFAEIFHGGMGPSPNHKIGARQLTFPERASRHPRSRGFPRCGSHSCRSSVMAPQSMTKMSS